MRPPGPLPCDLADVDAELARATRRVRRRGGHRRGRHRHAARPAADVDDRGAAPAPAARSRAAGRPSPCSRSSRARASAPGRAATSSAMPPSDDRPRRRPCSARGAASAGGAGAPARRLVDDEDRLADLDLVARLDADLLDERRRRCDGTSIVALSVSSSSTGWSLLQRVADVHQDAHDVAGGDVLTQFGKREFSHGASLSGPCDTALSPRAFVGQCSVLGLRATRSPD